MLLIHSGAENVETPLNVSKPNLICQVFADKYKIFDLNHWDWLDGHQHSPLSHTLIHASSKRCSQTVSHPSIVLARCQIF